MKKQLLILAFLVTSFLFGQNPKVKFQQWKEVTTTERNAFTPAPNTFPQIYNITTDRFEYWDGDSWECMFCLIGTQDLEDVIAQDPVATSQPTFEGGLLVGSSGNGGITSNVSRMTIAHDSNINVTAPSITLPSVTDTENGRVVTILHNWDASSNSPTLANTDVGFTNVCYKVSVAGTVDFGAGDITFGVGDYVINNGSTWSKFIDNNQSGSASSPLTTKGDLYTYSTEDARLPVGTNGQVLSANSSEPTGLEWIDASNSDSDITTIANITAMKAFTTPPSDNALFYLQGYYDYDDGGEGLFRWDNASTTTDDGGVYIKATTITTGRFVRVVENNTVTIEQFGGRAGLIDGSSDDSQAYLKAIAYLQSVGGGTLIFPYREDSFYVTALETDLVLDGSNITIRGEGGKAKIFIDSENPSELVNIGRGTFFKIANGTDGFIIKDLLLTVDEGCLSNNFINATICSEEEADWKNVTIDNVDFIQEDRALEQQGSHAISFYRNTADILDTASGENLKIVNCNFYITGHSNYAIHLLATVKKIKIDNNEIIFTNTDADVSEAYNGIAIYGDSEYFTVSNNYLYGEDVHSLIAVSGGSHGLVIGNTTEGLTRINEAGFEYEYKQGHQTYLTDPDYQGKGVSFVGNTSRNNTIGYLVARREIFNTNNTTDLAPQDVIFDGNFSYDATQNDMLVANNISGTPDYTHRIKGIKIINNTFNSSGVSSNLHIYDSDGAEVINNTLTGGDRNIHFGRSTTIFPIGHFLFRDNKMYGASVAGFFFESGGDDLFIEFASNLIDVQGAGGRGVQAIINQGVGTIFDFHHNKVYNATDGYRMDTNGANVQYSSWTYNWAFDCSVRGFDVGATDGQANYNTSINCTTADTYIETGMLTVGNRDN